MSNARDPHPVEPPQLGWHDLQAQLDTLRGNVEQMLRENPDTTAVYEKFADMAGAIVSRASPDEFESVNSELGAILRDLQLTGDSMD
ncbi:hypothetical protein ABIE51_002111 [Lysobacter sp. OAE881]|uniref:hypothetical protein n=1 Tax=Lysobacter sp. OAE881 TaxID=2663813 RepID=UPI001789C1E2